MPNGTPEQLANLKPMKKGHDPRRNLRGVPKDAIAGRKMIRKIGAELLRIKESGEEYDITRFEAMIRLMYSSRAPKDKETLLKALMPGLLKEEVDIRTPDGTKVVVEYVNQNSVTDAAPSADENKAGEEEA